MCTGFRVYFRDTAGYWHFFLFCNVRSECRLWFFLGPPYNTTLITFSQKSEEIKFEPGGISSYYTVVMHNVMVL